MKNYKLKDLVRLAIDDQFSEESPMKIEPDHIHHVADQIRFLLSDFNYLEMDKVRRDYDRHRSWRHVLDFTVNLPTDFTLSRIDHTDFTLELDRDNQLKLSFYDKRVYVSSLYELFSIAFICQSYAEEEHEEANRRQEIRDSKTRGILAHLKKLAHEKGYVFGKLGANFSEDMNVYVQVGETDMFSLKLVYKYYPEILELIDPAICTMNQLYDTGINFRLEKCPPDDWFHGEWITPESLDREEKTLGQ